MTSPELVRLLQEFTREKLALRERHIEGAQRVANYDFNNTYQYIVNREDTQISWLRDALIELGADAPDLPMAPAARPDKRSGAEQATIVEDERLEQQFLGKWRPRVKEMTNARHRKMLDVILGEAVEHERFFQQMTVGRDDVLGRRTGGERTGGGVLPVRWLKQ